MRSMRKVIMGDNLYHHNGFSLRVLRLWTR